MVRSKWGGGEGEKSTLAYMYIHIVGSNHTQCSILDELCCIVFGSLDISCVSHEKVQIQTYTYLHDVDNIVGVQFPLTTVIPPCLYSPSQGALHYTQTPKELLRSGSPPRRVCALIPCVALSGVWQWHTAALKGTDPLAGGHSTCMCSDISKHLPLAASACLAA